MTHVDESFRYRKLLLTAVRRFLSVSLDSEHNNMCIYNICVYFAVEEAVTVVSLRLEFDVVERMFNGVDLQLGVVEVWSLCYVVDVYHGGGRVNQDYSRSMYSGDFDTTGEVP
ncbi:hypothetical protein Tco_1329173 [Tanacetum coccineum]